MAKAAVRKLPKWGWLLLLAAALVGFYLYRRNQAASAVTDLSSAQASTAGDVIPFAGNDASTSGGSVFTVSEPWLEGAVAGVLQDPGLTATAPTVKGVPVGVYGGGTNRGSSGGGATAPYGSPEAGGVPPPAPPAGGPYFK